MHRQWDQPDPGGNFKSFFCFFLRKLYEKIQTGFKTEGEGTPLGQASPQSHHLYSHYNSYLFTNRISTEMEATSKGSARERKLIVFKLVVSNILLQCMEAAFILSPVSFMMLNDKTAMLSIAWAMNHSVEQLFTQKMHVLLIQQPEQSRSLSYKVT